MKLNDLDLNKLHVFRVVAENGSLRLAAAQLLRTPSAMSQSISSLEASLALPLFRRIGIRLELTEAGRLLLKQIRVNEEALSQVLDSIRGTEDSVMGLVSLGLPIGYPAAPLGEPLTDTLQKCTALQLRLRFLNHSELAHSLKRGQLDLALSLQPLSAWNRRIRSLELRKEHLVLALPPSMRAQAAEGKSLSLSVVDYFQKPLFIESWIRHHRLDPKRQRLEVRAFGATLEHVLEFVRRGLGAAVVPRAFVEQEIERGSLLEHALDRRNPLFVGVWLNAYHSPQKLSAGARVIWDELVR